MHGSFWAVFLSASEPHSLRHGVFPSAGSQRNACHPWPGTCTKAILPPWLQAARAVISSDVYGAVRALIVHTSEWLLGTED